MRACTWTEMACSSGHSPGCCRRARGLGRAPICLVWNSSSRDARLHAANCVYWLSEIERPFHPICMCCSGGVRTRSTPVTWQAGRLPQHALQDAVLEVTKILRLHHAMHWTQNCGPAGGRLCTYSIKNIAVSCKTAIPIPVSQHGRGAHLWATEWAWQ